MPEGFAEVIYDSPQLSAKRREYVNQFDICIVGAGVAGTALAWYLGSRGFNIAVIERDLSEPEKLIGELLQPGGVMKLEEMGLADVLEGIDAQNIYGYSLFMNDENFSIPYSDVQQEITGRGFRYGKFVMNLREKIRQLSSVTLIEGSVMELLENRTDGSVTGVRYLDKETKEKGTVKASLTVICDGGFSKLRENLNQSQRKVKGFMLGLLLKNSRLPYPGYGHVFLSGNAPFLCYPISSSEIRILIDFPGEEPPNRKDRVKQYLKETIGRQMPVEMRDAYFKAIEEEKYKAMPNVMLPANPLSRKGVVMLGDALNMRHPITGGGMTVALTDVLLLGSLLSEAKDFHNQKIIPKDLDQFYKNRHSVDATINILADALYDVLSYPDLKKACFEYLQQGYHYSRGPIAVLSAVSRNRPLLIRHFFAVALHGALNKVKQNPNRKGMAATYRIFQEAVHIITPLLLNEKPALFTRMMLKIGKIIFPGNNNIPKTTIKQQNAYA